MKKQDYDRHISFDPRIVGGDALLNLGVCLFRQAKLTEAEKCFQDLIRSGLQVKAAKANLKAISRLRAKHHSRRKKQGKSRHRKKDKPGNGDTFCGNTGAKSLNLTNMGWIG